MTTVPLVVGGAGFIGSAVTRRLAQRGPVRVLDDLSTGLAANIDGIEGVDLRVGSVLDDAALAKAVDGVSDIYHLACLGVRHSIHQPLENHEVNAAGTLRLLRTAREAGIARFVYTSSSEVYGTARMTPMSEEHPARPHTVYGASKLAGEAYVRAYHRTYGLQTVILRPFNAYGPRSHHEGDSGEVIPKFLVRVMNGLPPVVFGDGSQTRDFTYVKDTAEAIVAAAQVDSAVGMTINVGSGSEVAIAELASLVGEVAGRPGLEPEYDAPRPGDVLRLVADTSRAERLLDWRPGVGLADGLSRLLDWHRERGTDWVQALEEDDMRNWMSA